MDSDSKICVCIIEDDDVIRAGYASLLNEDPDFMVVGSYGSFDEKMFAGLTPDVLLLDIGLPGVRGIDAIPQIKKIWHDVKILMLTVHDTQEFIFTALKNGASGYLTKNEPMGNIKQAIKNIWAGGGAMSSSVARQVIQSFGKNFESPLTKRETEILEMMAEGRSRSKIATSLFINVETVKSHLKNIYFKLDVNSREEAIQMARKNRFI